MKRLSLLLVCLAGCQCQLPPPPTDAGVDAGVVDAGTGSVTFLIDTFGEVARGEAVERTGTLTNSGSEAVELSPLTITGSFFTLVGTTTIQVPAGGEATTQIRFAPTALGPWSATLSFGTQTAVLNGTGTGPALELTPSPSIDLGTLPLYDGFPTLASSSLTVRNIGVGSAAQTALQVFFDVQSTTAPISELCVGDCTGSPLSIAVDGGVVVPLQLTALTEGIKTWQVRAFSNDPDAPITTVLVNADVVARPTCLFAVPSQLAFGVLTSPERRDLEVLFENVGTDFCDVTQVIIGNESLAGIFSVLNRPVSGRIMPGELLHVLVRAWPQTAPSLPTTASAQLRIAVNHPDGFARVALSANLEPRCVRATPSPLDYGTVQTGCRSADRVVTLENLCPRSVVVTSATLPAFSPFSLSAALPRTLAPTETISLTTRYAPFAVSNERGVIDVSWVDAAATKHTTIPLLGQAAATGENLELYPPQERTEQGAFFPLRATPDPVGAVSIAISGQAVVAVSDAGVTFWTYDVADNGVRFGGPFVPMPNVVVSIDYSVSCAP